MDCAVVHRGVLLVWPASRGMWATSDVLCGAGIVSRALDTDTRVADRIAAGENATGVAVGVAVGVAAAVAAVVARSPSSPGVATGVTP